MVKDHLWEKLYRKQDILDRYRAGAQSIDEDDTGALGKDVTPLEIARLEGEVHLLQQRIDDLP